MNESIERNRTDDLLDVIQSSAEQPAPRKYLEQASKDTQMLGFGIRALYESLAYLETNRMIDRSWQGLTVTEVGQERLSLFAD